MKILVDADACPVVDIILDCARRHCVEVILVCDTAHCMQRDGARTVTVDQGADRADIALANMTCAGDIVVTQDYGVAALALGRKAIALHQNGMRYTDGNIDSLLMFRHEARRIRRGGGRLKGPAKRDPQMDADFRSLLENVLTEAGNT